MKNIHIIINPAAGADVPVLSYLNKALNPKKVKWDVTITRKAGDGTKIANSLIGKVDVVGVYGGDGTVMEVAKALYKTSTPMGIIPGGTANIMAKELLIPLNIEEATDLLINENDGKIKKIDMASLNGEPFLSLVHLGLFAEMVRYTKRKSKEKFGVIAYLASILKRLGDTQLTKYRLRLDGMIEQVEGVALIIANTGNIGLSGISFVQDIKVSDGFLDVILLQKADVQAFMELAQTSFMNKKARDTSSLKRWKAKNIEIEFSPKQTIVSDDKVVDYDLIEAKIMPKSINIIVPKHR